MAVKRRKGDARANPKEERWGFDSGVHKYIEIPRPRDPSKNPFRRKTDAQKPAEQPSQQPSQQPSEEQKTKPDPPKTDD